MAEEKGGRRSVSRKRIPTSRLLKQDFWCLIFLAVPCMLVGMILGYWGSKLVFGKPPSGAQPVILALLTCGVMAFAGALAVLRVIRLRGYLASADRIMGVIQKIASPALPGFQELTVSFERGGKEVSEKCIVTQAVAKPFAEGDVIPLLVPRSPSSPVFPWNQFHDSKLKRAARGDRSQREIPASPRSRQDPQPVEGQVLPATPSIPEILCRCGRVVEPDRDSGLTHVACPDCGHMLEVEQGPAEDVRPLGTTPLEKGASSRPRPGTASRGLEPASARMRRGGEGLPRHSVTPPADGARLTLSILAIIFGTIHLFLGGILLIAVLSVSERRVSGFMPRGVSGGDYASLMKFMVVAVVIIAVILVIGGILLTVKNRTGLSLITMGIFANVGFRLIDAFVISFMQVEVSSEVTWGASIGFVLSAIFLVMVLLLGPQVRRGLEAMEEE